MTIRTAELEDTAMILQFIGEIAPIYYFAFLSTFVSPIMSRYFRRAKDDVKKALSDINWHFREKGRHLVLFAPGRICTSSPELGVPSGFSDISEFSLIAEVSESSIGYIPELSYGSHIFQDLVEAGILYTAVFEGESTVAWCPELLNDHTDMTDKLTELPEEIKGVIRAYDVSGGGITLYYDMGEERLLICAQK